MIALARLTDIRGDGITGRNRNAKRLETELSDER